MRQLFIICWLITISLSLAAQEKHVVQIKTFDQKLQVFRNIEVSVNDRPFVSVGSKGVVTLELNSAETIQSVKIKDEKLEAASWNFSKGVIEIVVRPKSYTLVHVTLILFEGLPVSQASVLFKGAKPLTFTTDQSGRFDIPLGLNEKISSPEQFNVPGFQVTKVEVNGNNAIITVQHPVVVEKKAEPLPMQKQPVELDAAVLDSIRSLRGFYGVFRTLPIRDLDEPSRASVDNKFNTLLNQREDSLIHRMNTNTIRISDSSLIAEDVHNLLTYAGTEMDLLETKRMEFENKIELISAKLQRGVGNLSEQERQNLLRDLDLLENLLIQNETRFNLNQQDYREIIEALRKKYFDIEELQTRLTIAEQQRVEEQKVFQTRLIAIGGVLVVFAILIILLISFSGRLRKQAKELKAANEEVKTINENLEGIVIKRTQLLEASNRELDTFLYRASHDLRSPIRSILGLFHIKDHIPSSELVDRVTNTMSGMDGMLKKLISVSEIKRESENLHDIRISDVINEVHQKYDQLIRQNEVQFNATCADNLTFRSNALLLDCIISNLIENAITFSAMKHSGHARVEITAQRTNGNLVITVYDNGVGIDEAVRPQIFNMFFAGHEKSKGNGLGLYMVSKCVSELSGTITLESELNRFTKFTISLPSR